MKTIFIHSIILSCSLISNLAHARSLMKPELGAALHTIEVSDEISYFGNLQNEGKLNINLKLKSISLEIPRNMPSCPADEPECKLAMVMPFPFETALPLVSIETDFCNVTEYRAVKDDQFRDGFKMEIVVRDNRQSHCKMLYPAKIEVSMEVSTLRNQQAQFKAFADGLISGGLAKVDYSQQFSCKQTQDLIDAGFGVQVVSKTGTNFYGKKIDLGYQAHVYTYGIQGVVDSGEFHAQKFVSDALGGGVTYRGKNFSLRLPVVAPREGDANYPRHGNLRSFLKGGTEINQDVRCSQ